MTALHALPKPTHADLEHIAKVSPDQRVRLLIERAVVRMLVTRLLQWCPPGATITVADVLSICLENSADAHSIVEAVFTAAQEHVTLAVRAEPNKQASGWVDITRGAGARCIKWDSGISNAALAPVKKYAADMLEWHDARPSACAAEAIIVVECKNEILGRSIAWRGPVRDISGIHNIPARETAMAVAKDGKARQCGMWHVRVEK